MAGQVILYRQLAVVCSSTVSGRVVFAHGTSCAQNPRHHVAHAPAWQWGCRVSASSLLAAPRKAAAPDSARWRATRRRNLPGMHTDSMHFMHARALLQSYRAGQARAGSCPAMRTCRGQPSMRTSEAADACIACVNGIAPVLIVAHQRRVLLHNAVGELHNL